jgi:dTDP-4-dehydrorhamnose reductase
MKLLILGVSGLIGHKLLQVLSLNHDVYGTLHHVKSKYNNLELFDKSSIIDAVDVLDFEQLKGIMHSINPDVVLNCVGITKRKIHNGNILEVIETNAVFPHKLANWAKMTNKRVIHFSTDCVFNGKEGDYDEQSLTTAEDLYGRTKALGEIRYGHTLTIRSSFIGQELFDRTELLDWVLAQNGKTIKGYKNALYSGVSISFMAEVVNEIILKHQSLNSLYQLAPTIPISKYDLICIAKKAFGLDIEIIPEFDYVHKPTLNGDKLRNEIGIQIPSWEIMMEELATNKSFYKSYK